MDARDFDDELELRDMDDAELEARGIKDFFDKMFHRGKYSKKAKAAAAKKAAEEAEANAARSIDDEFDDLMTREVELD